jgi:hypothetical protein
MAKWDNILTGEVWDDVTGEVTKPTISEMQPKAGSMQSFGMGAERSLGRLKGGAQDVYSLATQQFSPEGIAARDKIKQEQAQKESAFSQATSDQPVSAFMGQMAPYMLTGGKGPGGRALTNAAAGLLTYNEDPSQRAMQGAAGLLGGGIGARMGMPGTGGRLAKRADQLGYKRSPGQILGSPGLQRFEAGIESFPPTSGAVAGPRMANQKITNQIAAKSIGEQGDMVTPEVLGQGADRIGQVFDEVAEGVTVKLGDDFLDKLGKVEEQAIGSWVKSDPIRGVIDNALEEAAKGPLTGERYLQLSSMLGRRIRAMSKSQAADPEDVFMLKDVKSALDDSFEAAVPKENLARLKEARKQWNNLLTLETGYTTKETGDVSGSLLGGVLSRKDKAGYKRGKNKSDLYDAARVTRANPSLSDSGTASRSFMQWMLSGNPATLPMRAGAGIAANPLARLYMNSPKLMNQAIKQLPPAAAIPGTGLLQRE